MTTTWHVRLDIWVAARQNQQNNLCVQADLSLSWTHRSLWWFCRAAAHFPAQTGSAPHWLAHFNQSTSNDTRHDSNGEERHADASAYLFTGRGSSIGSVFAWHASGPEFDPHVRHILPWRFGHEHISTAILPLPLIQEEQLSVTGEIVWTKYWGTA